MAHAKTRKRRNATLRGATDCMLEAELAKLQRVQDFLEELGTDSVAHAIELLDAELDRRERNSK